MKYRLIILARGGESEASFRRRARADVRSSVRIEAHKCRHRSQADDRLRHGPVGGPRAGGQLRRIGACFKSNAQARIKNVPTRAATLCEVFAC